MKKRAKKSNTVKCIFQLSWSTVEATRFLRKYNKEHKECGYKIRLIDFLDTLTDPLVFEDYIKREPITSACKYFEYVVADQLADEPLRFGVGFGLVAASSGARTGSLPASKSAGAKRRTKKYGPFDEE